MEWRQDGRHHLVWHALLVLEETSICFPLPTRELQHCFDVRCNRENNHRIIVGWSPWRASLHCKPYRGWCWGMLVQAQVTENSNLPIPMAFWVLVKWGEHDRQDNLNIIADQVAEVLVVPEVESTLGYLEMRTSNRFCQLVEKGFLNLCEFDAFSERLMVSGIVALPFGTGTLSTFSLLFNILTPKQKTRKYSSTKTLATTHNHYHKQKPLSIGNMHRYNNLCFIRATGNRLWCLWLRTLCVSRWSAHHQARGWILGPHFCEDHIMIGELEWCLFWRLAPSRTWAFSIPEWEFGDVGLLCWPEMITALASEMLVLLVEN